MEYSTDNRMNIDEVRALTQDIEKNLSEEDYCEDIYLSLRDGISQSKSFKNCAYFESEGWLLIWTKEMSYIIDREDVGDFVVVPSKEILVTL